MTMIDPRRLDRLEGRRLHASAGSAAPLPVPHIIEFALTEPYLNVALFPRQATLLKLMFCRLDLLTGFDEEVLEQWSEGFSVRSGASGASGYRGQYGTPGDIKDRMRWCTEHGREWFRETIFVGGRRGSKSLLGAVAASYVVWRLLALGDPGRYFAIAAGKQLHVPVFAGQHDQARANQWKDVHDLITTAPCFRPFVAKTSAGTLWLYSPAQLAADAVAPTDAAIVISAKQATMLAGRGPATPVQVYDEMAHMAASGANRSAQEVFSAAHPALAQFGAWSFLYEASSPWTEQGQFHLNYRNGLAVDPDTGAALSPDTLVLQLASYDLFRDWERTEDPAFLAWPDGPPFTPRSGPLLNQSAEASLRRIDPERYDVEFEAQWATSESAFLPPEHVAELFGPWNGQQLQQQLTGALGTHYVAHVDPARSQANFSIVIAHRVTDQNGTHHVVVDYSHAWRPRDFADVHIDFEVVFNDIHDLFLRFRIQHFSYDQYDSAGLFTNLRAFIRNHEQELGHPALVERPASAPSNSRMSEALKTALGRGLIHAPHDQLLEEELRHLEIRNGKVGHPTRGPVQTDDLAVALMNIVDHLIGDHNRHDIVQALSEITITGSQPRSYNPYNHPPNPYSDAFSAVNQRTHSHAAPRGDRPSAARGGWGRYGR